MNGARASRVGLLALLWLSACGGGDGTSALVRVDPLPPGSDCPAGGVVVSAGPDRDGDGVLGDGEVTSAEPVCTGGAAGFPGRPLVRVSAVEPGPECPGGGARVEAGLDEDLDGVLDADEVQGAQLLCDGAPGDPGAPGEPAPPGVVLRVDPEPAGEGCSEGGVAVHSGVDDDGDGVLDDEEIDATELVCAGEGGSSLPTGVLEGSYRIQNSLDVAFLAGVTEITGSLIVDAPGLTTVRVPALARVGADLTIATAPDLVTLELPALDEVGGTLSVVDAALTDLDAFARLTTLAGLRVVDDDALTDLSGLEALETVDGLVEIRRCDALVSLAGLSSLRATGDLFVGESPELPGVSALAALRTVDGDAVFYDLPKLASLAGLEGVTGITGELALVGLPALTAADTLDALVALGGFRVATSAVADARFPVLATMTGGVDVNGGPLVSLAMPALTSVGGDIALRGLASLATLDVGKLETVDGELRLERLDALTSVDLSTLTWAGHLALSNTVLTALDAPAAGLGRLSIGGSDSLTLIRVGGDIGVASVSVAGDTLREISLESLIERADSVVLRSTALELINIAGTLEVTTTLTVTGTAATALNIPLLTTAKEVVVQGNPMMEIVGLDRATCERAQIGAFDGSDPLTTVRLGQTSVTGDLLLGFTAFAPPGSVSIHGAMLDTVRLPNLVSVGGRVELRAADSIPGLDLSALDSVGGLVVAGSGQPELDTLAALRSVGDDGIVITDNSPLADVSGLSGVTRMSVCRLVLTGNGIADCAAQAFADQLGTATGCSFGVITGNDPFGTCP